WFPDRVGVGAARTDTRSARRGRTAVIRYGRARRIREIQAAVAGPRILLAARLRGRDCREPGPPPLVPGPAPPRRRKPGRSTGRSAQREATRRLGFGGETTQTA